MVLLQVYCKTCNKKVKAKVLKRFERQYHIRLEGTYDDDPTKCYFRYGLVQILPHKKSLLKSCTDTSQFKTIVESDKTNMDGILIEP